MLDKALNIAYKAHWEQTDKAGAPYILHPMRVSLHCQTEDEKDKVTGIKSWCPSGFVPKKSDEKIKELEDKK